MLLPLCGPSWYSITSSSGIRDRQLSQENLIDQREDGGVGANPEAERKDRDD